MDDEPLIVAIDGPSGVGKSTVARLLAARLGIPFVETGAMYRALGLKVLEKGVDPGDRRSVERLVATLDVRLERRSGTEVAVLLDGSPLDARARAPEVSETTSRISTYREVRRRMVEMQRSFALRQGAVMEGRDIGTKVFPETRFKFFLTARPEVRIDRRYRQLRGAGQRELSRDEVAAEVERRDERDAGRSESPLTRDESYRLVDTSERSPEQVVEAMARAIEELSRREREG